jgi:hypothetical protein
MSQETNLNISPYFDDFDKSKNYFKVLFKPGYPVQARELTTLQSVLQDQIEKFGNHIFKDGDSVTGGGVRYLNTLNAVLVETTYSGVSLTNYLSDLLNKTIVGSISGVKAKVKAYLNVSAFPGQPYTLFVSYLSSTNNNSSFLNGETLIIEDSLSNDNIIIQSGEPIANIIPENAIFSASAATLSSGIYFIRGYFIEVPEQTIILEPYNTNPSYRVGLEVFEEIINSDIDSSLTDNAKGFSNYAAPGADRLKIRVFLTKKPIDNTKYSNFIELMVVQSGTITSIKRDTEYNDLAKEFARRTYNESGDYYVNPISIEVKETLNNLKGNKGIFFENQLTYNNNIPNENLGTYKLSPTKAYIQGYEVETVSPIFLDFKKPRTTKLLTGQSINYLTGPTYTLNRVSGSPNIGISTSYTVSLRDERIGISSFSPPGKEIGVARVYDFALESGSYSSTTPNSNSWDISLFDIQTYTEILLNEPITLSVPTYIKGNSSGAIGFLRYSATNSGIITAYNTKGFFAVGETFSFNGISNTRVSTSVTAFSSKNVKSIYGTVGSASTFTGDVQLSSIFNVGLVNITPNSGGISTVTTADLSKYFSGKVSIGDIVSYSTPGLTVPSFAKVNSVSQSSLVISGITTVSGVCDGSLPSSSINPSDFKVLTSSFQSSIDNTLYTPLPKSNVSSVDLTNSDLIIRKQFDVTISSNSTAAITAGPDESFLPFDEERYVLIRSDGGTEVLSQDKFVFTNGGATLTINGLSADGTAKLIATLRKVNIKSKIKNKNRVKSIDIVGSKYSQSGIGTTTLNDGLAYSSLYGTRVQDEDICLLVPEVTKIHAIFESNSSNNVSLPSLTLSGLTGPTNKTGDLLIGEEFTSKDSKFVGIYVGRVNDLKINYISLNSNKIVDGETILFKESGISATVTEIQSGDNNITSNFILDNGQKETYYDYSKITRKPTAKEPTKKLKILFESAEFSSSDNGDITSANSYQQFDYCDIAKIDSVKVSDLIDIRPRVSEFTSTNLSPFEFNARNFTSSGNSASNVLASDESFILDYSFYLPRIDKIYLTKDGVFQLINGIPEETPKTPNNIENALEVATITLPPYICNISEVSVNLTEHKRYRMSDIKKLEDRIQNLEFYTSLSLLESDTSNLYIRDVDGLNRFKSGFFVDDFSTTNSQITKTIVKNSIDIKNSELRPSHYTNTLDLVLGSNTVIGIGTTSNPTVDQRFVNDLDGINVTRTGRILTLDYAELEYVIQPFATRVENVTPYLVNYYAGTIELNPSSDIWVDTVKLKPKTLEVDNYTENYQQLVAGGFDPNTGYGPTTWESWKYTWTGEKSTPSSSTAWQGNDWIRTDYITNTKTGTKSRNGTRQVIKEVFNNLSFGDSVVSIEIASYLRSRNIEFIARRLKPSTQVYAFFDGVDINEYIVPKLIEISMTSGTFEVGETVVGSPKIISTVTYNRPLNPSDAVQSPPQIPTKTIEFRVAAQNHKYGPYDNPTDVYSINPYNNQSIADQYSSTSTILNIDTFSLSDKVENNFSGSIEVSMILTGQKSGAIAEITNLRLITDNVGTIIGCIFIPDPNVDVNPHFETGTKVFRISSDRDNSQIPGLVTTSAEEKFESTGILSKNQENIVSIRNLRLETQTQQESDIPASDTSTTVVGSTIIGSNAPTAPTSLPKVGGTETFVPILQNPNAIPTGSLKDTSLVSTVNAVQKAYVDYLGRRPDSGGESFWINQVSVYQGQGLTYEQSIAKVQQSIRTSAEATVLGSGTLAAVSSQSAFTSSYGGSYAITQTTTTPGNTLTSKAVSTSTTGTQAGANAALITAAYNSSLGRAPDAAGFAYWNNQVATGALTIQQALTSIQTSAEAKAKCLTKNDPLAQSFYVETEFGVYVTRVDLYFRTKDPILPVIVQLRPMSLGLPTEQIYPFSEVVVDSKYVNVSEDASVPTTVYFDSPVYLPGAQYHALVLLSTSNEYTAWISRLGEVDISTASQTESNQIVVTSQPNNILGSLFKSQNGLTWNPSQLEDLKFTLYRATFTNSGSINFYNPRLDVNSDQIFVLLKDSLEISSRKIRVGLGSTVQDSGLTLGNTVLQYGSNATGIYVGSAGISTGSLNLINAGIGYTPSSGSYTFSNVSLSNVTGSGRNATANITISNGVAIAATISNGGTGYSVGDVLTASQIGGSTLGRNLRLSVSSITGANELILDNVQGDFISGVGNTVLYINNSGITTTLNQSTGGILISDAPVVITDGLHIKVNDKNHGMHSNLNRVEISNVASDVIPTKLLSSYSSTSTSDIILEDATNFGTFENVSVATTNPGYILIGNEIISYTAVSGNTLTGTITRSIDQTNSTTYTSGSLVYKYELNGISLRRINKVHNLSNSTVSDSIDLDYFNIKIDTSSNGIDRSVGTSLPKLYFNESKSTGGNAIKCSENIQYEVITPIVENVTPVGTNISASIRTITATSVDGSEISFVDNGFEDISLRDVNYLNSPRLIASRINEVNSLPNLPGNKSFTLSLNLTSSNPYLSPVIDLDRVGMVFTSNRVNAPITDYIKDNRTSDIVNDPNAFVYAINPISLEVPATCIKIYVSSYINIFNDIRAFYAISNNSTEELIYYPFPGYSNILSSGQIIDISNSDGTPDKFLSKTDSLALTSNQISYKDLEFTVDNLPPFRFYSIKIIGTSTSQAYPPRLKDLRVIALA